MQWLGALLNDNAGRVVVIALVAAVVLIAILFALYRWIYGRRLHMAGGRSRQPRLGVVDAFDLDRQRQLVLIRRDNVEHLLMIGGPNDIVIESAFVRAQPSVAVPGSRDKEISPPAVPVSPAVPVIAMAPPVPEPPSAPDRPMTGSAMPLEGMVSTSRPAPPPLDLVHHVSSKDLGPLSDIPAPAAVEMAPPPAVEPPVPSTPPIPPDEPQPVDAPAPQAPLPPRPLSRLAQGLPPRPPGSILPPRPPLGTLRPTITPGAPPARPLSGTLPNRPMPLTPLQRGTSAASLRRDPPAAGPLPPDAADRPTAEGTAPPPEAQSGKPQGPTGGPPITLESIESLEEEMAKLLGRAAGADKK